MKSNQSTNTQEQLGYQKSDQNNYKFWWVVLLLCHVSAYVNPLETGVGRTHVLSQWYPVNMCPWTQKFKGTLLARKHISHLSFACALEGWCVTRFFTIPYQRRKECCLCQTDSWGGYSCGLNSFPSLETAWHSCLQKFLEQYSLNKHPGSSKSQ